MAAAHAPGLWAAIDTPAAGAAVPPGLVRVTGWVLQESGRFEAALLVVDGGLAAPVQLGGWRPDLAPHFAAIPHASSGGFDGAVDLRAGVAGTARIALLVKPPDGEWREAAAVRVRTGEPGDDRPGRHARAAFTIVHDEPVMLPLWLRHYARHFDPADLFVLAHDDPGAMALAREAGAHAVPVHREAAFDHYWLRRTVQDFQAFLLRSYDAVLFAEADELVVANPLRYDGLSAYIDALDRPAARCAGFNVVQQPDEPPLALDVPVLAQRRCWHASLDYSKRLLSRVPLRWSDGFHREFSAPDDPPDPDLLLVHLHRADYEICLGRHRAAASRRWNEEDLRRGDGAQNRIVDPAEFKSWFRGGDDLDAPPERIPEHLKEIL